MKDLKESSLMCVLALALAIGLSAAANDVPQPELKGELTELELTEPVITVDPCDELTTDAMVVFECLVGEIKADRDEAAEAICYFKAKFEAATWQILGYDCL